MFYFQDLFLKVLEEEEMGEESEEWENEESVEVDATLDDANAIEVRRSKKTNNE